MDRERGRDRDKVIRDQIFRLRLLLDIYSTNSVSWLFFAPLAKILTFFIIFHLLWRIQWRKAHPSESFLWVLNTRSITSPFTSVPGTLVNAQKLVKSPFTQFSTNKVLKPLESDLLWHDIISPRQSIETSEITQQLRNICIRSTTMSFSKHLDWQQVKVS